MVDQRYPARSRGVLTPVIGGIALLGVFVAGIAFRDQVWDFSKWLGRTVNTWATGWAPDHPRETAAIVGFALVAFAINWVAHVRGRLRAWVFALVVEAGLWTIFWYGLGIPSLNELLGLNIARMSTWAIVMSGAVVIAVTGTVFWLLEAREEWLSYRRRHHVDDD